MSLNSRHELSKLRQSETTSKDFREGIHRLAFILAIESTRRLETVTYTGQSPISEFEGHTIKPRIGLTPILRAGLGMTDALVLEAPVYHLGLFREKVTLQPVEYYSKLPSEPSVDSIFLLDPLIATGGTACAAMSMLVDWGIPVKNIKLLCVLASREGLAHVQAEYPELEVRCSGFLVNVFSDGDRLFNTTKP
ncbi:uracil phosphoribosyltransferase-domain-containing protein [Flagelloscypha sp. PMI_526]|nr:uracil phosphoribosyltransferase-domain-containing protein [Flagelloscypha sp. PMI_526]